jgi:hypothetical protein
MGACTRAAAIADEAAVPHEQRAPRYAGQQDAILVVQETHAFDGEVHALAANAGAVGVLGACAAQRDAAHGHVVAGDDKDALAKTCSVADDYALGVLALDDQPVGAPHGAILIGAWSNANDISLPRDRRSRGGRMEGATRANIEDSRLRRQRRRQYQHQQGDRGETHGRA